MHYPLTLRSKRKMHQRYLRIPKSQCPDIWIRLPKHKWPKSWSSMEDPVVPLERNLYRHPLGGLLREKQFEKVLLEHGWEKVFNLGMFICQPRKRSMLIRVCGRKIKLVGKTEKIVPTWKNLMDDVDLGESTSFLDRENLGCTQRVCQI